MSPIRAMCQKEELCARAIVREKQAFSLSFPCLCPLQETVLGSCRERRGLQSTHSLRLIHYLALPWANPILEQHTAPPIYTPSLTPFDCISAPIWGGDGIILAITFIQRFGVLFPSLCTPHQCYMCFVIMSEF